MIDYKNIITFEAQKRSGKPCIRHLRITVYDILRMLADGMQTKLILHDYPELNEDDSLATLAYAAEQERVVAMSQ